MNKRYIALGATIAITALSACSSGSVQSSLEPKVTTVNPVSQSVLQFAVGTVKFSDGSLGLNAVETLRQTAAGYVGTSVLLNAPTIVGPAGFVVPSAPDAYGDAGTGSISGYLITNLANTPGNGGPATTFDPTSSSYTDIASSSGFFLSGSTNSSLSPNLQPNPQPFYASNVPVLVAAGVALGGSTATPLTLNYIGGPPSFVPPGHSSTQDGTFGSGQFDPGFSMGFTAFGVKPIAGTYTLNVVIPTGISTTSGASSTSTVSATAKLAVTSLPTWTTAPTFTPHANGDGGGTITTFAPAGGGITEEFIELVDLGPGACQASGKYPYYYTFQISPGTATVNVPGNLGAAPPGSPATHTICTAADNASTIPPYTTAGDSTAVYGVAVDYPLLESTFPASNGVAAPSITTTGQDDITLSPATATNTIYSAFGGTLTPVASMSSSRSSATTTTR